MFDFFRKCKAKSCTSQTYAEKGTYTLEKNMIDLFIYKVLIYKIYSKDLSQ
jgi:hypothetical protein